MAKLTLPNQCKPCLSLKKQGGEGATPVKYNVQFAFRTVNNVFITLSTS